MNIKILTEFRDNAPYCDRYDIKCPKIRKSDFGHTLLWTSDAPSLSLCRLYFSALEKTFKPSVSHCSIQKQASRVTHWTRTQHLVKSHAKIILKNKHCITYINGPIILSLKGRDAGLRAEGTLALSTI